MSNSKITYTMDEQQILARLKGQAHPGQQNYKAFFSSWLGGITTDPKWMQIPIDDHMVHRGDGVFEAFKAINQKIYLLDAHLDRLEASASTIGLKLPYSRKEIMQIITETMQVSGLKQVLFRLFVSRGPGGFTANPQESVGSQLYLVVMDFKSASEGKYQKGAAAGQATIAPKENWMAQVKSCNYLLNVLMKKEALEKGWDFAIGVDSRGFFTEGPTENFALISKSGELLFPDFKNSLKGTTLARLIEILLENKALPVRQKDIAPSEIEGAAELMVVGTTIDVMSIVSWNGVKVGSGKPGPWATKFRKLLLDDMQT